jgi:hypothetical protein
MRRRQWFGIGIAAWAGIAACGAGDDAGDGVALGSPADREAPNAVDGGSGSTGASGGSVPTVSEEAEGDLDFQSPQAGKSVVFVPNPATNRVAVVNASTYRVETFASGITPRAVATVPGEDIALVVNEGTQDLSLLRSEGGETSVTRIDIGHPINAVSIAPDGKHAIAYFQSVATATGGQGAGTHQDASVVSLAGSTPRVWAFSVGFRPRQVRFSSASDRAFVITDDGVSAVSFDDAAVRLKVSQISLGNALSSSAADVQIGSAGDYAVARSAGRAELTLVDLATQETSVLDLNGVSLPAGDAGVGDAGTADAGTADAAVAPSAVPRELTDLDLSADGTHAYAVIRNEGLLLDIPVPGGFRAPGLIRTRRLGVAGLGALRLAGSAARGVLYSTANATSIVLVVDLAKAEAAPRPLRLRKAVRGLAASEDGETLLVLHAGAKSGGAAGGDAFSAAEGFSIVTLADGFAKFEPTSVAIRETDIMVTPDGGHIFSLLRNGAGGAVLSTDLGTLRTEQINLARTPSSIGILPAVARVFVGQESEGGMITFLDQNDGSIERTLSGFELASKVRQ